MNGGRRAWVQQRIGSSGICEKKNEKRRASLVVVPLLASFGGFLQEGRESRHRVRHRHTCPRACHNPRPFRPRRSARRFFTERLRLATSCNIFLCFFKRATTSGVTGTRFFKVFMTKSLTADKTTSNRFFGDARSHKTVAGRLILVIYDFP